MVIRSKQRAAVLGQLSPQGLPRCQKAKCVKESVVFRRMNWFCAAHDPGEPQSECQHPTWRTLTSETLKLHLYLCSYCGATRER